MAFGPGKYDDLATLVREKSNAAMVLLAVIQGDKGSGLSVQGPPDMGDPKTVAALLRGLADQIERTAS